MPAVDASIVLLPRHTTLVGSPASGTFDTVPLDVSSFSGAQFQIWRGPGANPSGLFQVYLEESLDSYEWVLGASAPEPVTIGANEVRFFSYSFRLRWFRLRVSNGPGIVTCWAEGLLRGGGVGAWPRSGAPSPFAGDTVVPAPAADASRVQEAGAEALERQLGGKPGRLVGGSLTPVELPKPPKLL